MQELPGTDQDILRELFEVWNPLGVNGIFVFFRGYIDESYDPEYENVFTLSCLVSTGRIWINLSRAWKLMLDSWNRRLKKQGRPKISRYHAADCSNLKKEFKGWSVDEQKELFGDILKIFNKHQVDTVALSVNLQDMDTYFPEARKYAQPDFRTFFVWCDDQVFDWSNCRSFLYKISEPENRTAS